MTKFNSIDKPLAFDLGAYNGKDTIFLHKNNYKVVSVEANPKRYKRYIKILDYLYDDIKGENICISNTNNDIIFYTSKTYDVWDSCNIEIAERKTKFLKKYQLKGYTILDLISKYGIPEYIKCDIEGNDILMLQSLLKTNIRPKYISCESECQGNNYNENKKFEVIDCMKMLGYTKFFLFDNYQNNLNEIIILPKQISKWNSYEETKQQMLKLSDLIELKTGSR